MSILANTLFTILPIFIFVFYAIYTKKAQKKMSAIEHLFFNNSSGKLEFHLQTPAWLRVRHIVPCFATDQARFHRYMEYQYE